MSKPIDDQENLTVDLAVSDASFDSYYQKFLSPQGESREESEAIANLANAPTAARQGIPFSPLMRNSLMGAGSLAATLAVGFFLTDGANSQLVIQAPDPAPQPQPDASVVEQSHNTLFDLVPVPSSPESMDQVQPSATSAARRPMREVLAERLKQLQAEDEARLRQQQQKLQQMTAIANRNNSANQDLQAMAQRRQALAQANAANAAVATSQSPQATTPNAQQNTASVSTVQATPSPLAATSIDGQTASPQVVAATQADATPPAEHASASRLEFDRTVALQGYDLSVFNPNLLDLTSETSPTVSAVQSSQAESSQAEPEVTPSADRPNSAQPANRAVIRSLQGIQDFISLPQRLETSDRPNLLPLTQQAALEVANLDYYNQFLVFHLSPQQYQKLWGAKQLQSGTKRIPTYGVIDYQRRVVIVPQSATIARTAAPNSDQAN